MINNTKKQGRAQLSAELYNTFFQFIENDILAGSLIYNGEPITSAVDEDHILIDTNERINYSKISVAIGAGLDISVSPSYLDDLINVYSQKNTKYAHKNYLEQLSDKPLDKTINVKLYEALGIENDAASQLYLDTWMTGAVARALNPGCKFELMLILTGKQGCGKSTFLANLCPDKSWFLTDSGTDTEQNTKMKRSRAWIIECGEVSYTFGVKARDLLKQDISEQRDVYRPPYGRALLDLPRHYVLAGTTNDLNFLNDPTGNRRFAVIQITREQIDNQWVDDNVDSIWSYYLDRYLSGGTFHLNKEQETLLAATNKQFTYEDPFRQQVEDIVENVNIVRYDSFKKALGLENANQNNKDLKLAVRYLLELGFESCKDSKGRYFKRVNEVPNPSEIEENVDIPF